MAAVRGGRSGARGRCGHRQDGAAGVGGGAGGWHSGGPGGGVDAGMGLAAECTSCWCRLGGLGV